MGTKRDVYIIFGLETAIIILFCVFAVYDDKKYDGDKYTMFQNVHVMIFVGFGFLMTFLKRYGYSAVGFNFLLGALTVQWAIICQGFYELNDHYKVEISLKSLYEADIAAAAVLISMGAVLGKTSFTQLLLMGIIEISIYTVNLYLGSKVFQAMDPGGSMYVHTFGAYFGLAVSYVINRASKKSASVVGNFLEEPNYTSDLFSMIGTIFLWMFWPSFNAIDVSGIQQHRAIINTYLSLASCCVTTFAFSLMLSEFKFDMVHIQNSTLAGGVAVGTAANLLLQPYGAVIIGAITAAISVTGYAKITPFLAKTFSIPDTCGVHNLHGMPGILAGVVGAIMASLATESMYNSSLYDIYPARINVTHSPLDSSRIIGDGRTSGQQALYQIIALFVTLVIAIISGLLTGIVLTWEWSSPLKVKHYCDDGRYWNLPKDLMMINKSVFRLQPPQKPASIILKDVY